MSLFSWTPLLPLTALRRLDLDAPLLHFIPVRAQRRAAALREALHHRSLRVIVRIREQGLEEAVHGGVAAGVGVLVGRLVLLSGEDVGGDTLPVLVHRSSRFRGPRRQIQFQSCLRG
jgi:hypothetical protein